MLMHDWIRIGAHRHPDKTVFHWVERNRSFTYGQFAAWMEDFAGALHHLGVKPGDRVTVFAHNGMDYLGALFACFRSGAIAALVNVQAASELASYLADHRPSVVIYTHDQVEAVRAAVATLAPRPRLVCMDGPQEGAESLPDLLAARFPAPADPADETALAHLSYTSGTTGKPKGACLMHEPTVRAARCIAERLRITPQDVSFGPTALSSSYQLVGNLLPPLSQGCTIHVMSRWSAAPGWEALEAAWASLLVANPTVLTQVHQESEARGRMPGRLRFGMSGGGPVPLELKKTWRDRWGIPLVESYGQSELGGFVGLGYPVLEPDDRLAPVGPPLPDKEVGVQDQSGTILPEGQIGELCIRGGFMAAYWDHPEKTAETLRGGWLHTGDAGFVDRHGYVTMRGRFAELLHVAGQTWFPRDVEEALLTVPGVEAASLVGIPGTDGDRPVAFVVVRQALPDQSSLRAHVATRVPYDVSTLEVRTLDRFPMTPTGKIAKAELRAEVMA